MKTILLIMGLIGCSAASSYAQNKTNGCAIKTVHHKTHHRKAASDKTAVTVNRSKSVIYTRNDDKDVALSNLNRDNTHGCIVDSNGDMQYSNNSTYLGYYSDNYGFCDPYETINPHYKNLVITSSAFANNGVLPAKYTCQGEQVSPPLSVTNIPPGTVSLAIVMFDPYATAKKSTTYWLMWNLDTTGVIPENFTTDFESRNAISKQYGYQAVCPLGEGTHYYHFRVYALDTKLRLGKDATKATLENTIQGHVLAKGELVGKYNKRLD